jgi:hypothetical protein
MVWKFVSDDLIYQLNFHRVNAEILNGIRVPSKRELLQVLMSVFDPFGLLSNFTVHGKIIVQAAFHQKVGWDDPISPELYKKWTVWLENIQHVKKFKIPRCYVAGFNFNDIELHTFVDSSEAAFAAVSYFRFIGQQGEVKVVLVAAKTKVTPKRLLTIPRLELQAAVLGTRLVTTICNGHSFRISRRVFWSDSTTVLQWIHSDARKYKVFVAHRIAEILEVTNVQEWRWVPTSDNVADEATKWRNNSQTSMNARWFMGPEMLQFTEEKWPVAKILQDQCLEELRSVNVHEKLNDPRIVDALRFSNWWIMIRTVARVIRYFDNFKAKKRHVHPYFGPVTADEIIKAEKVIIRQCQWEEFAEEIITLQREKALPDSSKLYTLSPYLDDGILRIRGRIDAAQFVNEEMKRPIILPRKSVIIELLVMKYHREFVHQGDETIVNELRQKYYIPGIRVCVNTVVRSCQLCKIKRAMPTPPEMAPLPYQRITPYGKAFLYTGVDLFGPFDVTVGRRIEKRYGVLFTCLVVRAVHIEMAFDQSADSFIICLRNFLNRRGMVLEMWSDNGRNFTAADKILQKAVKEINESEQVQSELSKKHIVWKFITPGAPHHGGPWERMVRSAKKVIYALMKTRAPRQHTLQSFFIEAENVINARPLTHVPVERDVPEALTPNHFLLGASNGMPAPGRFSRSDELTPTQWRFAQMLTEHFWKRWIKEYLPDLTRRVKWFKRSNPIRVGDLVIVLDENLPRNTWRRGLVSDVILGRDGQVRSAFVKTSTGIFKRPATRLAVLDIESR